jgi:hypothetical protein
VTAPTAPEINRLLNAVESMRCAGPGPVLDGIKLHPATLALYEAVTPSMHEHFGAERHGHLRSIQFVAGETEFSVICNDVIRCAALTARPLNVLDRTV